MIEASLARSSRQRKLAQDGRNQTLWIFAAWVTMASIGADGHLRCAEISVTQLSAQFGSTLVNSIQKAKEAKAMAVTTSFFMVSSVKISAR